MNPVEMDTLAEFILQLQSKGYTLFIIEHNMRFIMSVAERIVVLNAGSKFREGSPAEIQADKDVQKNLPWRRGRFNMLEVKKVCSGYGKINVLNEISLYIDAGEIVAVIGANGAGKTTLLKTISGLIKPQKGDSF